VILPYSVEQHLRAMTANILSITNCQTKFITGSRVLYLYQKTATARGREIPSRRRGEHRLRSLAALREHGQVDGAGALAKVGTQDDLLTVLGLAVQKGWPKVGFTQSNHG
jgi:hypothetical protein